MEVGQGPNMYTREKVSIVEFVKQVAKKVVTHHMDMRDSNIIFRNTRMSFSLIVVDEFEAWERRTSFKGKASEKENVLHIDLIIKRKTTYVCHISGYLYA
jgi:hypothetical protein